MVSAFYGARGGEEPLRGMATGIASSLFIATPILLLEVNGRRLPLVRRLQRLPLVLYFAVRVVFYIDRHRRRPGGRPSGGHRARQLRGDR